MKYEWLPIAREIQSIAQAGLTFCESKYDIERYERLIEISCDIVEKHSDFSTEKLKSIYTLEKGYLTPKVDVRAVIIRGREILLVKETIDGCWSLPGGWADVGFSPSEVTEKEVKEESGLVVKVRRLLGIQDKAKHDYPPDLYYIYKLFFYCEEIGGQLQAGMETSQVAFFRIDQLPELSTPRNTSSQIQLMYRQALNPHEAVVFD